LLVCPAWAGTRVGGWAKCIAGRRRELERACTPAGALGCGGRADPRAAGALSAQARATPVVERRAVEQPIASWRHFSVPDGGSSLEEQLRPTSYAAGILIRCGCGGLVGFLLGFTARPILQIVVNYEIQFCW